MIDATRRDKRTLWGRFARYWLSPVWYWTGLYEPTTGKPSQTRLTSMIAFGVGVAVLPFVVRGGVTAHGTIGTGAILYTSLIFAAGFGAKHFDKWLMSRSVGQAFEATTQENVAAIAARRAQGGDYEATP